MIGEAILLIDPKQTKYYWSFWAFLGVHLARNLIFTFAFVWNIVKSFFTNHIAARIIAIIVSGIIFVVLQYVHYGDEENHKGFFLAYNIIVCLMILSAALRNNHTSPEGFIMMFIGSVLFMLSDVCYLSYFGNEGAFILALRTGLLMIGSIIVLSAGVHHVLYFKLKVQQITFAGVTGKELSVVKNKKPRIGESFDKTLEEPLV